MIEINNTLHVRCAIGTVWAFLNNIRTVTTCVPTVVAHKVIDDDTVYCDLRIKLGLIPLDSNATVKIIRREPDRLIKLEGTTEAGESLKKFGRITEDTVTRLFIAIHMAPEGADRTRVRFVLQAEAAGRMKRVYDGILKSQQRKLEEQFVKKLGAGLGAEVVQLGESSPTPGSKPG